MKTQLILQIQSTGQVLKQEETDKNAKTWEGFWCRRLLRYKRTPDSVKEAIRNDDIITGWSNFDDLKRSGLTGEELCAINEFLFSTYPER